MFESSKYKRENYPRKCFWTQERDTRVKFNPGLSANRPSTIFPTGYHNKRFDPYRVLDVCILKLKKRKRKKEKKNTIASLFALVTQISYYLEENSVLFGKATVIAIII